MKNKTEIKIGENKIINMFANEKIGTEVLNQIKNGVLKAFNFFDEVRQIEVSIEFIYSRDEFDKNVNRKTADSRGISKDYQGFYWRCINHFPRV